MYCKISVYVLREICLQWSKRLAPNFFLSLSFIAGVISNMKRIFLVLIGSANYLHKYKVGPNIFKIECPFASFENYPPKKVPDSQKPFSQESSHFFGAIFLPLMSLLNKYHKSTSQNGTYNVLSVLVWPEKNRPLGFLYSILPIFMFRIQPF